MKKYQKLLKLTYPSCTYRARRCITWIDIYQTRSLRIHYSSQPFCHGFMVSTCGKTTVYRWGEIEFTELTSMWMMVVYNWWCTITISVLCRIYAIRYTVYPMKNAHGFCFAVLCCGYTLTDFPISIRLTSLALWQSNDCPSASKATLMNTDKYFMWIHYERLHNHNKAKHNKTVCIFLGIYCMYGHVFYSHGLIGERTTLV